MEYWDGDPTNPNSTLLGTSYEASSSYSFVWATDPGGTNDGLHYICARAYDKAGNYLDSALFKINVGPQAPSLPIDTLYMIEELNEDTMDMIKDLIMICIIGALVALAGVMTVMLWKSRDKTSKKSAEKAHKY